MDIRQRKPKVINLRNKKIAPTPVPIAIVKTDISPNSQGEMPTGPFPCISCGGITSQELGRCVACNSEHQKLIAQLDAKPKQVIEKVPVKWVYYKQVVNGIPVTVRMTEEEALMTGRRITE